MNRQAQFLDVIDRDEAERRFQSALDLSPLAVESIPLLNALGRVLAANVLATVDVPSFDRSNVDGFAVRAADTIGASEEKPRVLSLLGEGIATGQVPTQTVAANQASGIATGGMLPRGADAVSMIEHTDLNEAGELLVRRPLTPGNNVTFAGTDIAAGELVLHRGTKLTSRETGVLAAIGCATIEVVRRPRVAIISTGDEIIAPGEPMQPARVFDSNAQILADAVRELNGEPVLLGIVHDDSAQLRSIVANALAACDLVLLSGGTSKGVGDLSYAVVRELQNPGIVAHGVALKPGKPICLAVTQGKPVVVLPGFPTSAIFTFHEFVAPVIRRWTGSSLTARAQVTAKLAMQVNSEIGRTEYLLVNLVYGATNDQLIAWPMGKGSGSVTSFSRADGFVTIDRQEEIVAAGSTVNVQLLGEGLRPADLVVIGSHCVGLDLLLSLLENEGIRTKFLAVGSTAGLEAAKRGQCDVAGIHLLDPKTGEYNKPFLSEDVLLVPGYGRQQGIVFRANDQRLSEKSVEQIKQIVQRDASLVMVNRNAGSGTRILIDQWLGDSRPAGYAVQPKNHNAVAAAIVQQRADWGVCIEHVARRAGLAFVPLAHEQYDFAIPKSRAERPAVQRFRELLNDSQVTTKLLGLGMKLT
jgi:putative molybdopterin biosynthesis protein